MSPKTGRVFSASATIQSRRDQNVNARSVDCPVCEAPAGENCSGTYTHRPRRRMAIRAMWQAEAFNVPKPDQIAKARTEAGMTRKELAAVCGVSETAIGEWERDDARPTGNGADLLAAWFAQAAGEGAA